MSSFIVPHFENSEHLTLITEKHVKTLEGFETVTCLQNNISKEEEPWMKDEDKALLRHFLGVARWRSPGGCMTYVEWGSGGSTLWALEYAKRVLSIENHPKWCRSMLRHPRIQCAIGNCFLSFTQNIFDRQFHTIKIVQVCYKIVNLTYVKLHLNTHYFFRNSFGEYITSRVAESAIWRAI